MESIVAMGAGEEFGEVKDIIARFDTLAATNHELIERSRLAQEKTEQDRLSFNKSVEVRFLFCIIMASLFEIFKANNSYRKKIISF